MPDHLRRESAVSPPTDAARVRAMQTAWASTAGIVCDRKGYVSRLEDALFAPLSEQARVGLEHGSGAELRSRSDSAAPDPRPAKILALHSSAALAVNVFDYWVERDRTVLRSALALDHAIENIEFERQFPTGLKGTPPNLDVVLTMADGELIAIESKFCEWMAPAAPDFRALRPSYFRQPYWSLRGLPACQDLAHALDQQRASFRYLDAAQLLKHALGLATQNGGRFHLWYLFYDSSSAAGDIHRAEIDLFGQKVRGDIGFRALSYQTLIGSLERYAGPDDAHYIAYLRSRYS